MRLEESPDRASKMAESQLASIISDKRLLVIRNNESLKRNLKKNRKSTIAEIKVAFWFIENVAQEIEYEPPELDAKPDFRIRTDDIEFFVEVKTLDSMSGESTVTESGIPQITWEFSDRDRRRLHDSLRKAKKGNYNLYLVFLQIPEKGKLKGTLTHLQDGKNKFRLTLRKNRRTHLLDIWTEDKTLSHDDHKFKCINAVYVFHDTVEGGRFVLNPENPPEKNELILQCLGVDKWF